MGFLDFLANSSAEKVAASEATQIVIPTPPTDVRRFSFRSLAFIGRTHKPSLSHSAEHDKREQAAEASTKRAAKFQADKRARNSALAVRALIIGPTSLDAPKVTPATAKSPLNSIKSQLVRPKKANRIIAQLRQIPASGDADDHSLRSKGPIHAVCLAHTDAEEDSLHFAKLSPTVEGGAVTAQSHISATVLLAPLDKLIALFNEINVVDLVKTPDFGLGQPGGGEGLLAGALPTPSTVLQGVQQITPELMALGYATGQAITPDHSGIFPPTDRISVLTYWWGLEVLLPPPSLAHLSSVQSISGTVMNLLSALSLVNNGVREILPFIRYIAQFIDFEFNEIKKQDRGQGVVCAATWIMPAAMMPRPWDFPPPPIVPKNAKAIKPKAPEIKVLSSSSHTPVSPAKNLNFASPISI